MAKVKTSKKSTRIDMTAMCDVAFLLLSFFIMTSTAKVPEPHPVVVPASTVQSKLPDSNLGTITVGEEKVFFGVAGQEVRKRMLQRMAEKYKLQFSDEQYKSFSLVDGFGVDIAQLPRLLELSSSDRNKPGVQQGIPYDSVNNQLSDWIYCARLANREVNKEKNPSFKEDMYIAIKGDKTTDYPTIKKVIDILQEQDKNNFFLVTGLRGENF